MSEEAPNYHADVDTKDAKHTTNMLDILPDLFAGVFLGQIDRAMSEAAIGVVAWGDKGKTGKVTIEFNMARIGETNQVNVKHSLTYSYPTRRGKKSETSATETPMHVGPRGRLTLMPQSEQHGLFKSE